jgi:hypothetical protein
MRPCRKLASISSLFCGARSIVPFLGRAPWPSRAFGAPHSVEFGQFIDVESARAPFTYVACDDDVSVVVQWRNHGTPGLGRLLLGFASLLGKGLSYGEANSEKDKASGNKETRS